MKSVPSGVVQVRQGAPLSSSSELAVEEPLEIRVAGETVAVTMRTPGNDHELVLGFLLAEGLIERASDLGRVFHCGRPGEEGYGNVIDATPGPGMSLDLEQLGRSRRGTLTTAACGVCGRRNIDDLLTTRTPLAVRARFAASVLSRLESLLCDEQRVFRETGGTHAAALARVDGRLSCLREDVGRHNAVDKAVGRMLLDAVDASELALVVSGRSSFEIVQKAARARIPVVVAVSAPTSLAVDAARRSGVTLIGFARGTAFNVYANVERIVF
ncbi:MAG TPA: formate dehydrogenase accessory sulfurtransferase FdhD [Polyangiaceae bacterium]|nr:formate dehydrogenase accessory sulfurtransferase FdhD [Polyangiaceae bacterium]